MPKNRSHETSDENIKKKIHNLEGYNELLIFLNDPVKYNDLEQLEREDFDEISEKYTNKIEDILRDEKNMWTKLGYKYNYPDETKKRLKELLQEELDRIETFKNPPPEPEPKPEPEPEPEPILSNKDRTLLKQEGFVCNNPELCGGTRKRRHTKRKKTKRKHQKRKKTKKTRKNKSRRKHR